MDLSDYIKSKNRSDQLNADDLVGGSIVKKIVKVEEGKRDGETVPKIYLEGDYQPWIPCKTMAVLLVQAWNVSKPSDIVGRYVELFRWGDAVFAGEKVGGIRVCGLSHIDSDQTFMVRINRKKKILWKVRKLNTPADSEKSYMTQVVFDEKFTLVCDAITSGKLTHQQAIQRLEKTALLTDEQKETVMQISENQ